MLNSVNFKFVMHQYVTVVSCVSVNKMFVLEKEETENIFTIFFRNETVVRKKVFEV